MRSIQRPNQYLRLRHDVWHYVRRVPKSVRHIETWGTYANSTADILNTSGMRTARTRSEIYALHRQN